MRLRRQPGPRGQVKLCVTQLCSIREQHFSQLLHQQAPRTTARGIKGLLEVLWGSKGSPGEDKKELERVLLTWVCCLCFDTHAESNCKCGEEGFPQLKLSFIPCGELKKLSTVKNMGRHDGPRPKQGVLNRQKGFIEQR